MDDIVTLINRINSNASNSLRVCMPGRVETYDFKTQKASVKLDMKELYSDNTEIDYPIVSGVPVVFMSSGGASLTMPINRGDTCLVIFADRDISSWLLGGSGLKPESRRSHALTDAIAIMGLNAFITPSKAENNTDVLLSFSDSKVRLKPNGIVHIETAKEVNIDTLVININCKNANIIATENVNVKANENINLECKSANIKALENINLECKSANIKASENINLESKNTLIKSTEMITVECVNAVINATEEIKTTSVTFSHTGDMEINGNVKITGTSILEDSLTTQNGISNSGSNLISNGITLETHTHIYNEPVVGSEPTAAVPGNTQGPN
jgi:phage gp45-like